MTDLIPEILQGHKPHAALVEQMVALKSERVKKRRRAQRDTVANTKRKLSALQKKEAGVVDDPLANLPAAKEQPTDSGEYYPIGMSAIFYLLAAAEADLKSGNKLAQVENNVMLDQFKSWAAQAMDYANEAKHSLQLEASTQMWNGIGSTISGLVSFGSLAGSLYTMRSYTNKIKALEDQKRTLESKRLDQPSIELDKAVSKEPQLVALASAEDMPQVSGERAQAINMADDRAFEVATRREAVQDRTVEADIRAKMDLPDLKDIEEPLTVKEQRLLKSKMNLEESRRSALASGDERAVKQYDSAISTVDSGLDGVKSLDKDYKQQVKDKESDIKREEKEEQSWQNTFQAANNIAQGANGVITGFSTFSLKNQQGEAEYQKALSDVRKQFGQTITQSYNSAIETVYRAIDQELSSIESTMKALYAAQSAGAA